MRDLIELLVFLAIILAVFGTAAWAGLRAAPWVPTRQHDVRRLLALAKLKPGETVFDLGAGDGRVLMIAAKGFDAKAIGFEISLIPYLVTRVRLLFFSKPKSARIRWADFFKVSFKDADVVFCFLTPPAMAKLKTKFVQEMRPGSRLVSFAFRIPDLAPSAEDRPAPRSTPAFLYLRDES